MKRIFARTEGLTEAITIYCPGCTHGITHRLVGEVLEELGLTAGTIGVASVGCSVMAYDYFNCDIQEAAHGRAPAVATAIKRVHPGRVVFTYQGDGDLASIGMGEIIHAAARGEKITVIFINNANYGMTGGQLAPTTLLGQKTSTTPGGRNPLTDGYPIRVCELLATLDGPAYIARTSTHTVAELHRTKKAIRAAFQAQLEGVGFALVEILSTCPTNWGLDPAGAMEFVGSEMTKTYPLGEFVNWRRSPVVVTA